MDQPTKRMSHSAGVHYKDIYRSIDNSVPLWAPQQTRNSLAHSSSQNPNHDVSHASDALERRALERRSPKDAQDITAPWTFLQQQTRLLNVTIERQEEEREHICLDIHDSVCQTLSAAHYYLETIGSDAEIPENVRQPLDKAVALVRQAGIEARATVAGLRPVTLDVLGLAPTLQHEFDELCTRTDLSVTLTTNSLRLPRTIEVALYRIVHEAVNNAVAHAGARSLVVRLRQTRGQIVALIRDDGHGFEYNLSGSPAYGKGIGLLSMRKRAELLNGRFDIKSRLGWGTRVRVAIPLGP